MYFGIVTTDPYPANPGDTCFNTTLKSQRVYLMGGWVNAGSQFVGGMITDNSGSSSGGGTSTGSGGQPDGNYTPPSGNTETQSYSLLWTQGTASTMWGPIVHNFGVNPSVLVLDSAGETVFGDVEYIDANTVVITFTAAFAGTALLTA